jgi:hypothetical protein
MMTAMQKSIVWVANDWLTARYENPLPSDCMSAVHMVVDTVLFRATHEDKHVATRALLAKHGHA